MEHPNRAGFRGVLTVIDEPSQRAPAGSRGKRVLLTRKAAENALPSLVGMALNYAPSFDRHDARRKVGVVTEANIVGKNLEVSGYLYAKDFPEVVEEIEKNQSPAVNHSLLEVVLRAAPDVHATKAAVAESVSWFKGLRRGVPKELNANAITLSIDTTSRLGLSFEVTHVQVADLKAKIWMLTSVLFTGAAIIRNDKTAFQNTWIEVVHG